MNNGIIKDYNWDKNTIDSVVKAYLFIDDKKRVGKINDWLKDWSKKMKKRNPFFSEFGVEESEDINKAFLLTNILIKNEKIDKYIKIDVLTTLIYCLQHIYIDSERKKYWEMLINFNKEICFQIKGSCIVINKTSEFSQPNKTLCSEIIKYFLDSIFFTNDWCSYINEDNDYTKNVKKIKDLFVLTYYYSLKNGHDFLKKLVENNKNFYSSHFFYLFLEQNWTKQNIDIYNKKFLIEGSLDIYFVFIKISKIKAPGEFIEFLQDDLKLRDIKDKMELVSFYKKIYLRYNKQIDKEITDFCKNFEDNQILKEHPLLSYKEIEFRNFDKKGDISKNSFIYSTTIYESQKQIAEFLKSYSHQDKAIFILWEFVDDLGNLPNLFNFQRSLNVIGQDFDLILEIQKIDFNNEKVIKSIAEIGKKIGAKKEVQTLKNNIPLLKSYLKSKEIGNLINEKLSQFNNYHQNISPQNVNSIDILEKILEKLDKCFEIKDEDLLNKNCFFIITWLNFEFISIISRYFYRYDLKINLGNKLINLNKLMNQIDKDIIENSFAFESKTIVEIRKYFNRLSPLTKITTQDNIWTIKNFFLFQGKEKKWMLAYINNNVTEKDRNNFTLILLKEIFDSAYLNTFKSLEILDNLYGTENLLCFLEKTKNEIMSTSFEKNLSEFASKKTNISYWSKKSTIYIINSFLITMILDSKTTEEQLKRIREITEEINKTSKLKEEIGYLLLDTYISMNIFIREITEEQKTLFLTKVLENKDYLLSLIKLSIDENPDLAIGSYVFKENDKKLLNDVYKEKDYLPWSQTDINNATNKLYLWNANLIFCELNDKGWDTSKTSYDSILGAYELTKSLKEYWYSDIFWNIEVFSQIVPHVQKNVELLLSELKKRNE